MIKPWFAVYPENMPVVFINRKISSVPADFLGMDFETANEYCCKTYFTARNAKGLINTVFQSQHQ